jgi:hypothetical protein
VGATVEVLDAAIDYEHGLRFGATRSHRATRSLDENRNGVANLEAVRCPKGEYAPTEVVDDRKHAGFRSVQESDDGRVSVPGYVGPCPPGADLGLLR